MLFLMVYTLVACDSKQPDDPWLPEGFSYSYSITSYDGNPDKEEYFRYKEYYDSTDRVLLRAGPEEGCLKFFYDSTGVLTEKSWGRNCEIGEREVMVYDEHGNHIGSYAAGDSTSNHTTPLFKQTMFYDSENRLIEELIRDYVDVDGSKHEFWRELSYTNGRISREILSHNRYIEWNGTYHYDNNNRLIAIKRKRGKVTQDEYFKYDKEGNLIEKKKSSNEYPLTPDVSFSAWNNRTILEYDSNGFLIRRSVFSHKGKKHIEVLYVRENKKP